MLQNIVENKLGSQCGIIVPVDRLLVDRGLSICSVLQMSSNVLFTCSSETFVSGTLCFAGVCNLTKALSLRKFVHFCTYQVTRI